MADLFRDIGRITALVQARGIVARAFCQSHKPCVCDTHGRCHAETIYRAEAEMAVELLDRAGLLNLEGRITDADPDGVPEETDRARL